MEAYSGLISIPPRLLDFHSGKEPPPPLIFFTCSKDSVLASVFFYECYLLEKKKRKKTLVFFSTMGLKDRVLRFQKLISQIREPICLYWVLIPSVTLL